MMIDRNMLKMMCAGRLHPEGWFFIRWGILLFCVACFVSWYLAGIVLIATACVALFFRDPERVSPKDDRLVVSPADGLIVDISIVASPPTELQMAPTGYYKISIFLNLWDVHVNRIPIEGVIKRRFYRKGTFAHAATEKAGQNNEQLGIVIQGRTTIGCVQIAGLVARRIICEVEEGDKVEQGQCYGVICFGSRVECYIPESYDLWVNPLQRMIGGETVLASAPS